MERWKFTPRSQVTREIISRAPSSNKTRVRARARTCVRISDGNGSPRWARLKCPDYLSSFCPVHALIGDVINHIVSGNVLYSARRTHSSRIYSRASIRVIIICVAECERAADARWINCVSRRHGDYNISALACRGFSALAAAGDAALRQCASVPARC